MTFKQLTNWWFETNGIGTDACHACVNNVYLCSWHNEHLANLLDKINQQPKTNHDIKDDTLGQLAPRNNETYKCQSYYDDNNTLQNCTCGKCGTT